MIGVAPPFTVVVRFSVLSAQIGPLLPIAVMAGFGLTVIVKLPGVPVQVTPLSVIFGVTLIVATTGTDPVLVAVKELIVPVPLAPRPIDVVLLVHS